MAVRPPCTHVCQTAAQCQIRLAEHLTVGQMSDSRLFTPEPWSDRCPTRGRPLCLYSEESPRDIWWWLQKLHNQQSRDFTNCADLFQTRFVLIFLKTSAFYAKTAQLLQCFSLGPARPVRVMMLICLSVCLFVCLSVPFPYIF